MIEFMIAIALTGPTEYPFAWGSNYCMYRSIDDMTHEEATAKVTKSWGEPTELAWEYAEKSHWCDDL